MGQMAHGPPTSALPHEELQKVSSFTACPAGSLRGPGGDVASNLLSIRFPNLIARSENRHAQSYYVG